MGITKYPIHRQINDYTENDRISMIYEKNASYIKHDQMFKELIHHFFSEFLEVFFPQVHEYVDFSSIKPMSEEFFTDLLAGENRRADIVIEAKIKSEDSLVIIHVEPQSSPQKNFHERMYQYFSLLYNKYKKPIIPIALFSYDEKRTEKDQFVMKFPFFHVFTFNFLKLELRQKNWRSYIQSNNPVAAALLSKMGYRKDERVQVKKEFLRMMLKMELNPARARFINDFFETYLTLEEREEEELMNEISDLDNADEFMKLPNSWEEKGIEKGKQEVALELLKEGSSDDFVKKITKLDQKDIDRLRKRLQK